MKVFIVDGSAQYVRMFLDAGWQITTDITEADLVQFTGGEDVSPFLYGQPVHPTTHSSPRRDLVESGYFSWAKLRNIPMAGICRGGQFLNVMNGGAMYQDVDSHAICGVHKANDLFTGVQHQVTSTHHQMMKPGIAGYVVATGDQATNVIDYNGAEFINIGAIDSVEVVYYNATKSLCFQPHPEFNGANSTRNYYFELLERYLELTV